MGKTAARPQLKELTVKGSTQLALGTVSHENPESLTVICGWLPNSAANAIRNAKLPNLKRLILYMGSDDYGYGGDGDSLRTLLVTMDFPKLEYLGIVDSETLTDKSGALLLEKLPAFPNIKKLDVHYHYLSDGMMKEMEHLPIETDLSDKNEPENYQGEIWMNAMLTE